MKIPEEYKNLVSQEEIDEWYDDAITNCYERMEDASDQEAHEWAEFCVNERLRQIYLDRY